MAYTKTAWVDGQAPAISAANLNKLETQYDEALQDVANRALGTGGSFVMSSSQGDLPSVVLANLDGRYSGGGGVALPKGLKYSQAKTDGTDQTAVVQAEWDALTSNGGGTWVAPIGTVVCLGDLIVKNDNATPPVQPPLVIQGLGEHWSGRGRPIPTGAASVLDLRGTGAYGHIVTTGLGVIGISRITLTDTSGGSTPFVYTTNTALKINQTTFIGSKTGLNCDQDAVILGGPNQVEGGGGLTDGFQGYGTEVSGNYFQGIRRGLYARAFANGIYFENNYNSTNCGNATGAFVEIDGKPTTGAQTIAGGVVGFNIIEVPNYLYGIWVKNAVAMSFITNDFFDGVSGRGTIGIMFDDTALDNRVIGGFCDNRVTHVVDFTGRNSVDEINSSGVASNQTKPLRFTAPVSFGGNGGIGAQSLGVAGDAAYVKADRGNLASLDSTRAIIATRPSAVVTDAAITSGSKTVTSSTAAWVASDQGLPIFGTGIPTNTFIARVVNSTTVIITKVATATATGLTVGFGRLGTEVTHALFERSHIVAQGSSPTVAVAAGAGAGASASVTGYDLAGSITLTAGTSPAAGVLVNVTNNKAYSGTLHPQITAADAASAALLPYALRLSAAVWQFGCANPPVAGVVYKFAYMVMQAA